MRISYDPEKNDRNAKERKLPFELAVAFEFETALIDTDIPTRVR